ncbi:MAG: zinc ribbon domain-containing protein [Defluviitaleaceae bacterium]|nr:zinc ribbon domain-containing protein [Defluviitaleaceae bacterium]
MYCANCGESLSAGAKFCNKCGGAAVAGVSSSVTEPSSVASPAPVVPVSSPAPVVPVSSPAPVASAPVAPASPAPVASAPASPAPAAPVALEMEAVSGSPSKPGGRSKFVLPAIAISAAAVVAVIVFVAFIGNSGNLAVSRAMGNLNNEFAERLETTPFQAIYMLLDTLQNGTVNVNINHAESWEAWDGSRQSYAVDLNMSLVSNSRNNAYEFRGNFDIDGAPFNLAAYINRDRVAVGSRQISRNYYGFRFNDFREDFTSFGRVLGLDRREMDAVSDFVEELGESLRQSNTISEEISAYSDAFFNTLREAETITNRVDVRVGGSTVSARRVAYDITDNLLVSLLREWLDIFEEDDSVRASFDSPLFGGVSHRETVRELRNALRDFERELRGEVTIAFYIGSRDRLLKIDIDGSINMFGERINFDGIIDFGSSVADPWSIEMTARAGGERAFFGAIWEVREGGTRYVNDLEIFITNAWGGRQAITLTSDWNHANGNFNFSGVSRDDWGTHEEEFLDGNFTVDGNNFRLLINQRNERWGTRTDVSVEVYTTSNNNVGTVDFVNIDDWGQRFLDNIEDALWDIGW